MGPGVSVEGRVRKVTSEKETQSNEGLPPVDVVLINGRTAGMSQRATRGAYIKYAGDQHLRYTRWGTERWYQERVMASRQAPFDEVIWVWRNQPIFAGRMPFMLGRVLISALKEKSLWTRQAWVEHSWPYNWHGARRTVSKYVIPEMRKDDMLDVAFVAIDAYPRCAADWMPDKNAAWMLDVRRESEYYASELEDELSVVQRRLDEQRGTHDRESEAWRDERHALLTRIDVLITDLEKMRGGVGTVNQENDVLMARLAVLERDNARLIGEVAILEHSYDELSEMHDVVLGLMSATIQDLDEAWSDLGNANRRINELEAAVARQNGGYDDDCPPADAWGWEDES
jgi:hypothetical protein